jgi:ketosteroid isomerase-like protein
MDRRSRTVYSARPRPSRDCARARVVSLVARCYYSGSRLTGGGPRDTSTGEGVLSPFIRSAIGTGIVAGSIVACSPPARMPAGEPNAGIDTLNARLIDAYRRHDAKLYGTLFTDSAVFEWPAVNTVRGRSEMEAMAQSNWAALADMELRLSVASRRIAASHATEHGAFQQSWRDSSGVPHTEYGRYVHLLARGADSAWRIDRFFGFSDSTRPLPTRP